MKPKLLTGVNLWRHITAAVKRNPKRCQVAVAYLGSGAIQMLPLKQGSELIVDLSKKAVSSGQSDPHEVLKFIRRDVKVYSLENLHAKTYVVGKKAIIGSANVSSNSAYGLVEAAIEVSDPSAVAQCRNFVKSLRGEAITLKYAKELKALYRRPKFHGAKKMRGSQIFPLHKPVWIVQLKSQKWDDEDYAAQKIGTPVARRKLKSTRSFRVDDFCWDGGDFAEQVKKGDQVVEVFDEGKGRVMVHPPARLIYVQKYQVAREPRLIAFLEKSKGQKARNLKGVVGAIGPKGRKKFRYEQSLTKLRGSRLIHDFLNLWASK